MAYLTPAELAKVALLRPDVLSKLTQLMALFEQQTGRKTFISDDGGLRSTVRQAAIYADSLAQSFRASPPGKSKHEWGAAFDLHIVGTNGDAAIDKRDPLYEKLAQLGESIGLKAGQHFRTGKPDPYHFEANETDDVSRAKWAELTRGRLWRAAIVGGIAVAAIALGWHFYTRTK